MKPVDIAKLMKLIIKSCKAGTLTIEEVEEVIAGTLSAEKLVAAIQGSLDAKTTTLGELDHGLASIRKCHYQLSFNRIDPPDCGCTDCITGWSKPYNLCSMDELCKASLLGIQDESGMTQ